VNQDLPYRRSAGVMLINRDGAVFLGRRKKSREGLVAGHEWQMPQGGVDDGEAPYDAARRELYEETSVSSISLIAEAPDWLSYDLPEDARGRWKGRYRGQTQKWFLMRFEGDEAEINIERPAAGAHAPEFDAWRWERIERVPTLVVPFKRRVYEQVVALFTPFTVSARA
jgi:putative (di)nucleoside polyphosphate hydrolase